jgi:formiminotetrahydrofolate cyclodeaminase
MSIVDFLNEVDAPTPVPGGGSVSALGIAQGISLIGMVGKLTMTKKKFAQLSDETKQDFQDRIKLLEKLKQQAILLIDRDSEAYNVIMEAYRLPKETTDEQLLRQNTINQATIHATQVPFETATIATQAIQCSMQMFCNIVKSAGSDFGVGILMIEAGLIGAILNVRTNMSGFHDEITANHYLDKVNELEIQTKVLAKQALEWVNKIWK